MKLMYRTSKSVASEYIEHLAVFHAEDTLLPAKGSFFMSPIEKSSKLDNVCYDIRGPVLKEAKRLEEEGNKVLKLNIGNPAPFGFDAPDEILVDVIRNLPTAQGYCDSKGLFSARKAIMQHYQARNIRDLTVEDIYIGNGVSELIVQSMQALLNLGDEMLVPAPDYPLWTAAVSLSSGKAIHYMCDEESGWFPDLDDIRSKITPRTRGIVIINPNNPTGAVYSKELLLEIVEIARQNDLIIFADEIYDKILYDDAQHHSIAALAPDLLTVTFNGLSKTYRVAGFRQGWMVLNGPKSTLKGILKAWKCWHRCVCAPTYQCSMRFKPPWAAIRALVSLSNLVAVCTSSVIGPGSLSTKSPVFPV